MSMLKTLGEFVVPEKIRRHLKSYIAKTGRYEVPYTFYGLLFLISLAASAALSFYFVFSNLSGGNPLVFLGAPIVAFIVIEIGLFLAGLLIFWMYYEFVIFRRTQKIEEVLPDFLQEVSINLKAGMSFDKALWNSVEPEFGVLETEIEMVAKKVMAGEDTEKAIKDFADKYDSNLLQESMDMIIVGLRSGGDVSDLIDKIVENVKDASYLRKELVASVTSYIIFISIIAIVISPALFALSFNLMTIIQSLGEKLAGSTAGGVVGFSLDYQTIDTDDFILFSKISVIIISSMSSVIIADLREGSIKAGLKYILLFIPISYFIYVTLLTVLTGLFGTLG